MPAEDMVVNTMTMPNNNLSQPIETVVYRFGESALAESPKLSDYDIESAIHSAAHREAEANKFHLEQEDEIDPRRFDQANAEAVDMAVSYTATSQERQAHLADVERYCANLDHMGQVHDISQVTRFVGANLHSYGMAHVNEIAHSIDEVTLAA